ncbi:FlhC family transcriptional regulator [Xanthomonas arboricola]|uniref:FlhC family transcriptional regulator n=1 Tax=Xanthomonas arboricola TaxID=56448 RepID=UPI000CEE2274|nr:FlhC family transcriptional regulator [Xanthomonas arboricola]PPT46465.1 hypothetical protein XarjCFBP7652_17710 [Xanthomonas arboricola]
MPTPAHRHLHALRLAHTCAELGARVRTIGYLTRLPHRELVRLFFADPQAIPRGRPPDSPEWYHSANVLFRAAASIFAVRYHRLRQGQFPPTEALISSYRHYLRVCEQHPRISFDRAFDLASHLDGIWIADSKSFSIAVCPHCGSEHLVAVGGPHVQSSGCPFCKIIQRFRADPRVQTSFPLPPLADPAQIVVGIDLLMDLQREGDGDIPPKTPE